MEPIQINTEKFATEDEKNGLKLWETLLESVQENFMKDEELAPVVFIGLKDEDKISLGIMPVADFMKSSQTKDSLAELMKKIGKQEPVFLSLVTEAWMSTKSVKGLSKKEVMDQYQSMPPSKDPEREEVLMCIFESENLIKQRMFKIGRDPLSLEEVKQIDGMECEGRFVGILKDMKKARLN